MNITNIKLIFRNFGKAKSTSLINILGFAFSISICFIITIYILQEFSYDKFHENYNTIYRIVDDEKNQANVDYSIKDEILSELPEVKENCHLLMRNWAIPIRYENEVVEIEKYGSADNDFFKVFSFPVILGNPEQPFDRNTNSILLSESLANSLFKDKNPMGEKVIVENGDEFVVTAVFKDCPNNSSIHVDMLRNETYEINTHSNVHCEHGKCEYRRYVFANLDEKTTPDVIVGKINSMLANKDKFLKEVRLQPLSSIYLKNDTNRNQLKEGNLKLIKLLSAIAVITLLLASINYINLSIAQYKKRIKEVGIKKSIGAPRIELIKSFLLESMVVTFLAIAMAAFITSLSLPLFTSFFSLQINVAMFLNASVILSLILFSFILGIVNGILPAVLITSFKPINLFQKRMVKEGGNKSLKNALTTFQFAVSITLIICVIGIFKQLSFIKHKDLGFQDSYLLKINTDHISNRDVMKEELLRSPFVINASYSSGIPGEINWGFGAGLDAKDYKHGVKVMGADPDFIKTLQFEILEGRDFLPSERDKVCLINETAMKLFEWNTWEGKSFNKQENSDGQEVIGVVKDFHFGSMERKIAPLAITFQDYQKSFLSVRISGKNIPEAMDYINTIWNKIEPNVPINLTFYDSWFDSMYQKEEQLGHMVSLFAILAIVISCLGIFGQAILNTANRIKEIGIRKVNGANILEVILLLNKDFVVWVLMALIIAAPLSRFLMLSWLENFAYKTPLNLWMYALAGITAVFIALLSVSWQSWSAARRNPVEALRYE